MPRAGDCGGLFRGSGDRSSSSSLWCSDQASASCVETGMETSPSRSGGPSPMSEHGWETLRAVGVAQSTRIAPLHLDMNGVDRYSLFIPPDPLSALQSAGVPGS